MKTLDSILLTIIADPGDTCKNITTRDSKILNSLGRVISSPGFITENKGRLLIKILNENLDKLGIFSNEVENLIKSPVWSKTFRAVDKTKKISLANDEPGIIIEFAFSSSLRKLMNGIWKELDGLSQTNSGKIYRTDLTEKNIVKVIETFKPHNFEIDEKIEDFYNTIKSWSKNEVENQFLLTNISHSNFQKAITQDLGLTTELDENIIKDRSRRYQFLVNETEKIPENLTGKIAFRRSSKIWINRSETGLDEIFSSLLELKRLPVLVIFDNNDHKKCVEDLTNLHKNLEKNGIFSGVGIYFSK